MAHDGCGQDISPCVEVCVCECVHVVRGRDGERRGKGREEGREGRGGEERKCGERGSVRGIG